jgi:hypothetical protein
VSEDDRFVDLTIIIKNRTGSTIENNVTVHFSTSDATAQGIPISVITGCMA